MTRTAAILGLLIAAGTVSFGGAIVYGHFAKTTEVRKVSAIQTLHILSVELSSVRRELWDLQGRYGPRCKKADRKTQIRCQQLIEDEETILRQLDMRRQRTK